jgi:hypothetical protein
MLMLKIGARSIVNLHLDQDLEVDTRSVQNVLGQIK